MRDQSKTTSRHQLNRARAQAPRRASPRLYRHDEIRRMRHELVRDGFPRLQMLLLVTLTGASGLLVSYLLLHAGLVAMWLRYLAAFGVAYLVFLFCLWLWLWLRTRPDDYDIPDPSDLPSSGGGSGSADTCYGGGGGQFGGGGASGSFGAPAGDSSIDIPLSADLGDSPVGDALDVVSGADEAALPLLAVLLVLAVIGTIVFSSMYLVYSAPTLFAELLVDGVLSASLYRRLRGLETPHWLETAVRRSAWPFFLSALLVSAAGWGMARYAPEAHSIGDVVSPRAAEPLTGS
jgi:hypothetical protein